MLAAFSHPWITLTFGPVSPHREKSDFPTLCANGRGSSASRRTLEEAWPGPSPTCSLGVWETSVSSDLALPSAKSFSPPWFTWLGGSPSGSAAVGSILSRYLLRNKHLSHIRCIHLLSPVRYRVRIPYIRSVQQVATPAFANIHCLPPLGVWEVTVWTIDHRSSGTPSSLPHALSTSASPFGHYDARSIPVCRRGFTPNSLQPRIWKLNTNPNRIGSLLRLLLHGMNPSADAFGPLGFVARGLCFVIDKP